MVSEGESSSPPPPKRQRRAKKDDEPSLPEACRAVRSNPDIPRQLIQLPLPRGGIEYSDVWDEEDERALRNACSEDVEDSLEAFKSTSESKAFKYCWVRRELTPTEVIGPTLLPDKKYRVREYHDALTKLTAIPVVIENLEIPQYGVARAKWLRNSEGPEPTPPVYPSVLDEAVSDMVAMAEYGGTAEKAIKFLKDIIFEDKRVLMVESLKAMMKPTYAPVTRKKTELVHQDLTAVGKAYDDMVRANPKYKFQLWDELWAGAKESTNPKDWHATFMLLAYSEIMDLKRQERIEQRAEGVVGEAPDTRTEEDPEPKVKKEESD